MKFFENARTVEKRYTIKINVCVCVVMLGLGAFLGAFSKYLDIYQTDLPGWLMKIDTFLDLHNFLGEFSPWIIIAVAIALYSVTPICAAVNVCVFFSGMVTSYYLYSNYVGGFFPRSYAMIWVALTIISPFLAYLCWFAKGDNWFSVLLSSGIIGFLLNTTFAYGCWYLDLKSGLELVMLLIGICMLRKSIEKTVLVFFLAIPFAVIMKTLIPFGIW